MLTVKTSLYFKRYDTDNIDNNLETDSGGPDEQDRIPRTPVEFSIARDSGENLSLPTQRLHLIGCMLKRT